MFMTILKMSNESILNANDLLDINSSYAIHQWLTSQQDKHRAEDKILYRILKTNNEVYFYIQSKTKFNLNHISENGFIFINQFGLDDLFNAIDTFISFDIQVCPSITKNHKKLFIQDYNKRKEWLKNQFEKHGMILVDSIEYKHSPIIVDKDKTVSVPSTTYKGIAKIINKEQFIELVINGLGDTKNFGAGLMLFKKVVI